MMKRYKIGYAMEAKKVKTMILPSLLQEAHTKGLDLIPVDPTKPLSEQGPFHCIIHKLYSPDWAHQLLHFRGCPVVDPPPRIDLLRSRATMLESVSRIRVPFDVRVPNQKVVAENDDDIDAIEFKFPVIAKPLGESHDMVLISNRRGLRLALEGKPAMVVQEFVNHGGVLFKVYVVGTHVRCVKRNSLPDFVVGSCDDVVPFSRVSNSGTELDCGDELDEGLAEMLAGELSRELGLRLFNVDVIRSREDSSKYYVIDINYFPGYAKMPDFEPVFTDFLLDMVRGC